MTDYNGLTPAQVEKGQQEYGPNTLDTYEPPAWWEICLRQFRSPLIILLVVASGTAILLKEFIDAIVIWAAILANVIVGFIQEIRAEKSLTALRKMIQVTVRVIRDGTEQVVDSAELVPGDIVLVGAGDKVPADIVILESTNLEVDEAALTGESVPVAKTAVEKQDQTPEDEQQLFMGTLITRGQATGRVTAISRGTRMGELARLVAETQADRTPLQKQMDDFSRLLVVAVLIITGIIFVVGIVEQGTEIESLVYIFETSVAVAVSAIPEGLALALTVALVLGMRRILARNALVRNLQAIDTLGATTVICTDKTGTLTTGVMTVVETVLLKDSDYQRLKIDRELYSDTAFRRLLAVGALCNEATIERKGQSGDWEVIGSPTESAFLDIAGRAGLNKNELQKQYHRVDEIPFESEAQYMATFHQIRDADLELFSDLKDNQRLLLVKGSPERVLKMLKDFPDPELVEEMTRSGLRVLTLGYKIVTSDQDEITDADLAELDFAGFVGLIDPLRDEARDALEKCQLAGMHPVILTGDHKLTARAIACNLGLEIEEKNIITGDELVMLSDDDLFARIEDLQVYARVTPRDKIRIVDAWQERGEVVAMTGDGVNDAPALKSANIGVALGSGTDVAKETADMVLLDNNFSTIVAAVEGGRVVFDNIRKVTLYLLSDSFSEMLLILGTLFIGLPLPLLPAQILYINILSDSLLGIALTYEHEEEEVMRERPRGISEPIVNLEMKTLIGVVSVFTGLGSLLIFYLFLQWTGDTTYARTVAFTALGVDSLFYVYSIRTLRHSIWECSPFDNRNLFYAVVIGLILQVAAIYLGPLQTVLSTTALQVRALGVVAIQTLMVIVLIEMVKHIFLVRRKRYVE